MWIATLFFGVLALTVLLALGTAIAGRRHRRQLHLRLALATLAMFVIAVGLAYRVGKVYAFPAHQMGLHYFFSRGAAGALVLVVLTGALLWRAGRWRNAHRVVVVLFLLFTICALGTGIRVFLLAPAR